MKSLVSLAILLGAAVTAQAAPEECRVAPTTKEGADKVLWKGPCKDGWADGVGVLEKAGEGKQGWRYEGAVQRGRPHGHGYMKMGDGRQYEGEYVDGQLEGMAIYLSPAGDRYDGSFKAGRRDGRGSMSYKLGGRYDGDWKNNEFHGRGMVEYPGGRKLTTTFVDGLPLGQTAPAAPESPAQPYHLNESEPVIGSNVRRPIVMESDVPLDKSYAQMTEQQRAVIKARYPLMDEADEPPYPINGMVQIQRGIYEAGRWNDGLGELRLIVQIDSEGKAQSVSTYASPDPKMAKIIAELFMLSKYKPASCAGKPCAMAFPYQLNFVRRY